ncbi:MAG: hypothetical protein IH801_04530 [Nitrospinae bacterium]|nr:hypothetical protein [Nitrospinota bacterium]
MTSSKMTPHGCPSGMRTIPSPFSAPLNPVCAFLVVALLVITGCAGKKKAVSAPAQNPAPQAAVKTSPPPSAGIEAEAKPSLLARLNPFGKRKAKPAEPSQPAQAEPEPQAKIKRKQGMLSRWFRRKPKTLPRATPKVLERRSATTAKGEVSPPPFEYKKLELSLGETTKAHIIATFGKPEHTFFSEGAEEILIYRRLRRIDSLYIFLDSQGLVKDYIITKRQ